MLCVFSIASLSLLGFKCQHLLHSFRLCYDVRTEDTELALAYSFSKAHSVRTEVQGVRSDTKRMHYSYNMISCSF